MISHRPEKTRAKSRSAVSTCSRNYAHSDEASPRESSTVAPRSGMALTPTHSQTTRLCGAPGESEIARFKSRGGKQGWSVESNREVEAHSSCAERACRCLYIRIL